MVTSTQALQVDSSNVSTALRQLRESRGLSQREVARLVGTSASAICRLEDERYRGHSLEMIRRVASALGVEVNLGFRAKRGRKSASARPPSRQAD